MRLHWKPTEHIYWQSEINDTATVDALSKLCTSCFSAWAKYLSLFL